MSESIRLQVRLPARRRDWGAAGSIALAYNVLGSADVVLACRQGSAPRYDNINKTFLVGFYCGYNLPLCCLSASAPDAARRATKGIRVGCPVPQSARKSAGQSLSYGHRAPQSVL